MIIKAIGEQKQINLCRSFSLRSKLDKRGVVVHNRDTGQTNLLRGLPAAIAQMAGRKW